MAGFERLTTRLVGWFGLNRLQQYAWGDGQTRERDGRSTEKTATVLIDFVAVIHIRGTIFRAHHH